MLTPFLKDVCMRGYHIMSLCVIFKTWIETFACPDIAECCHENPEKPGHSGQLVTYVPLKESLKSRLLLSRKHNYDMNTIKLITSESLRSCIQKKIRTKSRFTTTSRPTSHGHKSNFVSWFYTSVLFFWGFDNPRDFGVKMEMDGWISSNIT